MTQYIDKDALVAEIERIKEDALQKKGQCKRRGLERIMHQIGAYNKILSFLDTLEVKEVDLEEEFADFLEKENAYVDDNSVISYYNGSSFNHAYDIYPLAKHFFNLGLKAQKGE